MTIFSKQRHAEAAGPDSKEDASCGHKPQLAQGLVPEIWKEAHIVPTRKKRKDKTSPGNYRPISLISCVGKLTERIITHRLI